MAQQIKKKKANNVSVVSSCDVCAFVRCKKKKKKRQSSDRCVFSVASNQSLPSPMGIL